ncbi:hypothetical protein [Micromonospora fluostatini]|uniref:hypothetical protein n=1 Tax=Micromonospora sp. JCM 30529 TaxID=3421643 RepID=UPI003D1758C3
MAMLSLPATPRHRLRIGYALGLLAVLGAATTLAVEARDPALSATRLETPVPAPEIPVVEEPGATVDRYPDPWATSPDGPARGGAPLGPPEQPVAGAPADRAPAPGTRSGTGGGTAVGAARPEPGGRADDGRSLFWSGVGGLVISLTGIGLLGARRRMW